jgi:hypothetical protein
VVDIDVEVSVIVLVGSEGNIMVDDVVWFDKVVEVTVIVLVVGEVNVV